MGPSGLMFAFAAWSSMVTITQAGNESHARNASAAVSPLLLVSFDGFRADYLEKYALPNLREFHSDGVLVDYLTNVFITKTFPNHYSLVTGLYAESHGILANTMYDPVMDRTFSVHNHSIDAVWWNQATPIWVSMQNSGYKTAAAMWPGSDVAIQNKTPTYFMKYDSKVSFRDRVVNLTDWLVRDEAVRFAVLYWEEPDSAGHTYGPDNVTEMTKVLKEVDDNIGFLMQQLKSKGLWDKINVIVTSDHGMTQCSPDRLIQLDKCLNASTYTLVDETPVAAVLPRTSEYRVTCLNYLQVKLIYLAVTFIKRGVQARKVLTKNGYTEGFDILSVYMQPDALQKKNLRLHMIWLLLLRRVKCHCAPVLFPDVSFVFNSLSKCHSHMKAYMKMDIPDRLHYKNNVRIQPIILVADEGWTIVQNDKHLRCKNILMVFI